MCRGTKGYDDITFERRLAGGEVGCPAQREL